MLIVGQQNVYLSHLPMFQQSGKPLMPHRFQAILEVAFAKQEVYTKDRQAHPATIYMLNPDPFVLPSLAVTNPIRSITAKKIVRGHLERDGNVAILRDSDVTVKQVVHFREFDPKAVRPSQLEYLLFGKGQELFLAHLIMGPPDFDQVLAVKAGGHEFDDKDLAKGVQIAFPGTKNSPSGRLKAKQQIEGQLVSANQPATQRVKVEVVGELYFEEGELRVPGEFKSTAEEKKAGFP